jgi:nitrous oxide reductase accessory protein NosL
MRYKLSAILLTTSIASATTSNIDTKYPWCHISGNELSKYPKSTYIAKLETETRYYSAIRYLAQDYDNIEKRVKELLVTDYKSKKQIDALSAYYVVNSKKKGFDSRFSKFAFEKKSDAEKFIKKYSGDIRDFSFTIYLASRDLDEDRKAFEKKDQKKYFRGEKIYNSVCSKDIKTKNSIYEYMKYINDSSICGNLKDKDLQALSKYLIQKDKFQKIKIDVIAVPKDAKCPVCGMFVHKYPKWSALAISKDHKHYFDGNKDFFKFIFEPKHFGHDEVISELFVTDYYTLKKIEAKKAYYVVGSNVLGPMGHELISFEKLEDAKVFKREHLGKAIYEFNEIRKNLVYGLK